MISLLDNINYVIGEYVGNESLEREYKVYCMNTLQKYFDHEIIKQLFDPINKKRYTNLIDKNIFNKMVRNDISKNIIEYLPKYIGNFSASNIFGQLHFGIADNGIIEGIPYFGHNMSTHFIKKTINNCFKEYLRTKDGNIDDILWFQNNMRINIIKLNIDNCLLNDHYIDRLEKLCDEVKKAKAEKEQYSKNFKVWYETFTKYSVKLKTLINDFNIRKEIVIFINKQYQNKNNHDKDYIKAIEFYNSNILIDYEITKEMLQDCTNDNPLKWLIDYKDYITTIIKLNKPKQPLYKIRNINYYEFAKHMYNTRNQLLKNKCKFYIITFDIPKHPNGKILEYKDKYGLWQCKIRLINKYGPFCKLY